MKKVLEATTYPKEKGSFSIKITDEQIPDNNGIFTVIYENGKCVVEKDSSDAFDIAMDIPSASRLILGREGLTIDEINYLNNVTVVTDCADFLRAFPKKTTVFYDGF